LGWKNASSHPKGGEIFGRREGGWEVDRGEERKRRWKKGDLVKCLKKGGQLVLRKGGKGFPLEEKGKKKDEGKGLERKERVFFLFMKVPFVQMRKLKERRNKS